MPVLRIVVPGPPVPQNQGKVGRWRAKDGREGVTIRQPGKVRSYKVDLQQRMRQAIVDTRDWNPGDLIHLPFFGLAPVAIRVRAVFPCPTSDHRKTKPVPRRWHTGRYGNLDNIMKAIGDAGEAVLWHDDGQIARMVLVKIIGAQGEAPHVEIAVEELTMEPKGDDEDGTKGDEEGPDAAGQGQGTLGW